MLQKVNLQTTNFETIDTQMDIKHTQDLFLGPLQMNCQNRPLSVNVCNGQQLVAQ